MANNRPKNDFDSPRRRIANETTVWRDRGRALATWPVLIAVVFWIASTAIILSSDERLPYVVGRNLPQPVFSVVAFQRINEIDTAEAVDAAKQSVPNYFRLNQPLVDAIQSDFRDLHAAVKAAENYASYAATDGTRRPLDENAFNHLKALTEDPASEQFRRRVDALPSRIAAERMIERPHVDLDARSTAGDVMLGQDDDTFAAVPKERLTYAKNQEHVQRFAESLVKHAFGSELRNILAPLVRARIEVDPEKGIYQPIYVFDRAYTRKIVDDRLAALEPIRDSYRPKDLLADSGPLTEEELALLKAHQEEYLRQRNLVPELRREYQYRRAGLTGVVAFITLGLTIYTRKSQPRIAAKPARALSLALLLLLMLLLDRLVIVNMDGSPMWSVATITMTAAILTIAYSQIFAIGATAALSMLTLLALDASFSILLVHVAVAFVTVLLLKEVRTRLRMVEVGALTALVALAGALCVTLAQLKCLSIDAPIAALAALAGICVVLVLLPLIERLFKITTSLTLLEWADTSRPLLRQLIEKAPGTWQHSHLLGSMAEKAAEEIGANGLLVRVGAYYHDIGKMCKPQYFVENQQAQASAHRGLAPTMSLLVILAHVKDGLALAREHGVPTALHHFIAEHHGTTVVSYFHARATQEARAAGRNEREISETEFRYPGPKPHSRESAILMLCDSIEGAVRSLQDPNPSRIESVVHEIATARLMDGQFDDCDLTLKDLARVEDSLTKSLQAIYHGRIAYPKITDGDAPQARSA